MGVRLMKIRIQARDLMPALRVVARAIPARSVQPIVQHVLLDASNGRLTLTGSDLATTIRVTVDADVDVPGALCLPAVQLVPLAGALDGEIAIEARASGRVRVGAGGSAVTIPSRVAEEYPTIDLDEDAAGIQIEAAAFRAALARVLFAVSDSHDPRSYLTGVNVLCGADGLTLVASDGSRMSVERVAIQAGMDGFPAPVLIPATAFREVARIAGDAAVSISINERRTAATLRVGRTIVRSQLIARPFPAFQQLIPTRYATRIRVQGGAMRRALGVANVLQPGAVRLVTGDGVLRLLVEGEDVGEAVGEAVCEVVAEVEGEPNRIAVDARYLGQVLDVLDGEILIDLQGPSAPAVIRPADLDDPYVHILMSMPVQWSAGSAREAVTA